MTNDHIGVLMFGWRTFLANRTFKEPQQQGMTPEREREREFTPAMHARVWPGITIVMGT